MQFTPHRIKGFGLLNIVFIGLFLGGLALAGFKIGMPYADQYVLQTLTAKAVAEARRSPVPEEELAKRIFDRANIQSINLDYKKINIERSGREGEIYVVHIDMPVVIKLWQDATLHLNLSVDVPPKQATTTP